MLLLAGIAGYDYLGFHLAAAFERDPDNPAPVGGSPLVEFCLRGTRRFLFSSRRSPVRPA